MPKALYFGDVCMHKIIRLIGCWSRLKNVWGLMKPTCQKREFLIVMPCTVQPFLYLLYLTSLFGHPSPGAQHVHRLLREQLTCYALDPQMIETSSACWTGVVLMRFPTAWSDVLISTWLRYFPVLENRAWFEMLFAALSVRGYAARLDSVHVIS